LILVIIFSFSSPPHEKATRALAAGCTPAQTSTELTREPQRYAGVSFDGRRQVAASENDRFGHRVPLASSRQHVSLANAMRTRIGAA
jgi:hypothetical protein